MRKLIYRRAAVRNLKGIVDYIADSPGDYETGLVFVDLIRAQCAKLAVSPFVPGRPREELAPGLRGYLYRSYVIFFRCSETRLEIVNILHMRRDLPSALEEDDSLPK
jgi:toxin ParE1/3/4